MKMNLSISTAKHDSPTMTRHVIKRADEDRGVRSSVNMKCRKRSREVKQIIQT